MIKRFISRLTMPNNVRESHGDLYIKVYGIPSFDKNLKSFMSYEHRFQYQKIEQGFFGNWRAVSSWVGLNSPLFPYDGEG